MIMETTVNTDLVIFDLDGTLLDTCLLYTSDAADD